MKVSLEWFLLDNFAVNRLLLSLAGALSGLAIPPRRARLVALMGTAWDLVALSRLQRLLSVPGRVGCLLLTALCLCPRAFLRTLLSLFLSSLLLGGGMLLFTQGRAGWGAGVLLGTVPLRAAVYGLCLAPPLARGIRYLVHRGYEGSCMRRIALQVGDMTYLLTAFVDSGNLLTEPLSGLPVLLVEGIELPRGRPLMVEGKGMVEVVPATVRAEGEEASVPVFVGPSPLPLREFQALLPAAALQEGRKEGYAAKDSRASLSALRAAVHKAAALLSGALRGKPARAPFAGGGTGVPVGSRPERSGPQQAH